MRGAVGFGLAATLALAGCAGPRIVPVAGPEARVDAARGAIAIAAAGVELSVRASAWHGTPWDLADYVTPFLVRLTNEASEPVAYEHAGFRLFDEARFQYTALPPADVEHILRARGGGVFRLAAASPPPGLRRPRVPDPFWDWWWWDRYGWPWSAPPPARLEEVYLRALPVGALQPGARVEGFVYFPRLRREARQLRFEFHHRVGAARRVLTLPFAVERGEAAPRLAG
jgi:hypothetical protein